MSSRERTGAESRTSDERLSPVQVQVRSQLRNRIEAEVREEVVPRLRARLRVQFRAYVVGIALVSLLVGGLIGRFGFDAPASPSDRSGTPPAPMLAAPTSIAHAGTDDLTATATPTHLRVYVSGAVAHQRVVTVPLDALLRDALDAAGGATAYADLDALNLAAPLEDHQHVVVPTCSSSPEAPVPTRSILVNINSASREELQTLPGIGAKRAADIIDYRESYGHFQTVEDIQAVPGIGPAILEQIAPLITVEP